MSDYQRIAPVISFYESEVRKMSGVNFVATCTTQFNDLQSKYYSNSDNPDYSSTVRRFCYLYKYYVAHGFYIYSTLKRLRPKIKPSIFSRNPTRIACIGGGPGTEIIGICRYLREVEPENINNPIIISIFDKEPSWDGACKRVLQCVKGNLNIEYEFIEFDATIPDTYRNIDFSDYCLVMSNFFMSEIRKLKLITSSRAFWKYVFGSMGASKLFVAVDFADAQGTGWAYAKSIIPSGSKMIIEESSIGMGCPDSKACILPLEKELDHRPKKNGNNIILGIITG